MHVIKSVEDDHRAVLMRDSFRPVSRSRQELRWATVGVGCSSL